MRVEEYAFTFDELHENVVLQLILNSIYKEYYFSDVKYVGKIVDNDFSHGGKYLLPHKHIWINNECVIKESDLDVFLTTPCLEGHTISDIFANELYDEKSLFIF